MVPTQVLVLGVPIDALTMDETVRRIRTLTEDFRRDQRARHVVTVNVDFLVLALSLGLRARHPEFLQVLRLADLATADGMPVVWAAGLLGGRLPERVSGSDLIFRLAEAAASEDRSLFLLGGAAGVADRAAEVLRSRFPGLKISGTESPFVRVEGPALADTEREDSGILDRINAAKPDWLLICLGSPKQELWFHRNRNRLGVPVSIGLGGSFDFLAGNVRRAPLWMQRAGLEWMFRLSQEPGRLWKRYAVDFFLFSGLLLPAILWQKWSRFRMALSQPRAGRMPPPTEGLGAVPGGRLDFRMPARWDAVAVEEAKASWLPLPAGFPVVVLDFQDTRFIDSIGLGTLIRLRADAVKAERRLVLAGLPPVLRETLAFHRLEGFFEGDIMDRADGAVPAAAAVSPGLRFEKERVVVALTGRLDQAALPAIEAAEFWGRLPSLPLAVDLSGVDFADSAGLGFLVRLRKQCLKRSVSLSLISPAQAVRRALKVTRLDSYFSVDGSAAGKPGSETG